MSHHSAMVHHVVNGFASGDDRNDLLQEVLLAVWKSIPAFRGEAKATTYHYRVCHNAALLWIRTQKNYRRRVEQFGTFANTEPPQGSDTQTDERLARLYAAVHELRPLDRSLILLTPFLALVLHQLHAAGKVSPRELTSMALFFGATLLVCGTLLAARHFGRLRPEHRQLEVLLEECHEAAG